MDTGRDRTATPLARPCAGPFFYTDEARPGAGAEQFREVSVFDGDGIFGSAYQSVARPRLGFTEICYPRDGTSIRRWFVDHDAVDPAEIEARLALAPVFSNEERKTLAQLTEAWADRERQREIGLVPLMMLGRRGAVEWQDGRVRLWPKHIGATPRDAALLDSTSPGAGTA